MQQNNNKLTAHGYLKSGQHPYTIDPDTMQSNIRSDVVKRKIKVISNIRLRIVTGGSATVKRKTEPRMTITNMSVSHVFIVADFVHEFIIDADFIIAHGTNLNMGVT